ncbi:MAG: DUF4268 domain-containing protein [bacterium]|nr:DUF4268 domain-containing protein [bacterium]
MGTEVSKESLSKIRKVALRKVWPQEASDFTPWLEEHLGELGEALGMELEASERESRVGSRSLDIMATDSSGRTVIIENQLQRSDDNHLGRLLIYTAGKDADFIIWIAKDFEDEHLQVLQWLNQQTGPKTQFFGVAIELWKIDNSRPAPFFRVVAAPNDWGKRKVSPSPRYREFRQRLEETLEIAGLPFQSGGKHKNPWLAIYHVDGLHYSIDFRDNIYFSLQLDTGGGQSLEWCQTSFDRLQRDRARIEDRLGELKWTRKWGRKRGRGSKIVSYYPGSFSDQTDSWTEVHKWAINRYRLFREVFEPYRKDLMSSPLSRTAQEPDD